uniref:translation initiation factor IF-2-like n=1 Tax=Halichoerus grypus TaxID=9711 RepID=UPI0016597CAF|nr:translation initiation factor IF-2-like [Halichoerus grypus]
MRRGYATRQASGIAAQCLVGDVVLQVRTPRRWAGGGLGFPEGRARRKMEPARPRRSAVASLGGRCPQPTCPSPEAPPECFVSPVPRGLGLGTPSLVKPGPCPAQAPDGAEKARGSASKGGQRAPAGRPGVPRPGPGRSRRAHEVRRGLQETQSRTPCRGALSPRPLERPTDPAACPSRGGEPGGGDPGARVRLERLPSLRRAVRLARCLPSGPASSGTRWGCVSRARSLPEVFLHLGSRAPEPWRSGRGLIGRAWPSSGAFLGARTAVGHPGLGGLGGWTREAALSSEPGNARCGVPAWSHGPLNECWWRFCALLGKARCVRGCGRVPLAAAARAAGLASAPQGRPGWSLAARFPAA